MKHSRTFYWTQQKPIRRDSITLVILTPYILVCGCFFVVHMAKRPRQADMVKEYQLEDQEKLVKHSFLKQYPDRSTNKDRFYNFFIQCNDETGVDLTYCFVEIELKVVKQNGKNLDVNDVKKIQPVNDLFDALFSQVDLKVNGVRIADSVIYQPQTALLYNVLNHDDQFQNTVLEYSNMFVKDIDYPVDKDGLIRHDYIKNSKTVRLYGKLNHNGFTTKHFLLPNSTVEIQLERNPPEFCLIRAKNVKDKYKVEISSCKLNIRQVLFYDSVVEEFNKQLLVQDARFPFTKIETRQFDIPTGSTKHRTMAFNVGNNTPKCAYLAICDKDSLAGRDWENNPMIFPAAHYGVNYVQFYSDNNKAILSNAYEPDFENKNVARTYTELLQTAAEGHHSNKLIGITPSDFMGQYGLFPVRNMPNYGDLTVEVGFKKPISKLLTGLLFLQYDSHFNVNRHGGVSFN